MRDSRPGEAATLEALQRRAVDERWDRYREQLQAHPDVIAFPAHWADEGRLRIAVDDDDRVVGFSVAINDELDGVYVDPEVMGTGVGRLLFDDAVARARAQGLGALETTANANTRDFYAAMGFVPVGEMPSRFGQGVRMRLEL